jgi:hypothetical protein
MAHDDAADDDAPTQLDWNLLQALSLASIRIT